MDPTRLIAKLINGKSTKMTVKPNLAMARSRSSPKPQQQDGRTSTPNNLAKSKKDTHSKRKPETKYINGGVTFEAPKKDPAATTPMTKSEYSVSYSKAKKTDSQDKDVKIKDEPAFKPDRTEDEEMEEVDPSFLYRDIIADRDDNDENMAPLFWDLYSKKNELSKKQSIPFPIFAPPFEKVKVEPGLEDEYQNYNGSYSNAESLILFQLPQILLSRKEGKLGKLRVYNSGRLELLETKTGLVFDLQPVSCNSTSNCDVNHGEFSVNYNEIASSVRREAVVFSDRQLVCLGSIENSNMMLVRPQLEQFIDL